MSARTGFRNLRAIKRLYPLALLMILPVARAAESPPFSEITFEDALKQASLANKVVMIDFFTTWCGPCKLLDKNTWTDTRVDALLAAKAVALRVDGERE